MFSAVFPNLSLGPLWARFGPTLGPTGTVSKSKIRRLVNFLRNFSIFFPAFFTECLSIIGAINRCLVPYCAICRWAQIGPDLGPTGTVSKSKIRRLVNFLQNFSIFFPAFFTECLSIISAINRCLVPYCAICRWARFGPNGHRL